MRSWASATPAPPRSAASLPTAAFACRSTRATFPLARTTCTWSRTRPWMANRWRWCCGRASLPSRRAVDLGQSLARLGRWRGNASAHAGYANAHDGYASGAQHPDPDAERPWWRQHTDAADQYRHADANDEQSWWRQHVDADGHLDCCAANGHRHTYGHLDTWPDKYADRNAHSHRHAWTNGHADPNA